jgi:cytochrome c-type biogenesis protein CcmE
MGWHLVSAEKATVGTSVRAGILSARNGKWLLGIAIVVVAAAYLALSTARGSAYYLTVDELEKQGPSARTVRVAGVIKPESIAWDARGLNLSFDITDSGGVLNVTYHGARPDMLRDGAEVVVEGKYVASGKFEARQLLLKCPSKYEEKK